MSKKIVLIDGHSILNRAFFGIPDLTNTEGLHTNAVYGFLNIMFRILEEEKPKERKVTIKGDKISRYFSEDYSSDDIEGIIIQLLEKWQSKQ